MGEVSLLKIRATRRTYPVKSNFSDAKTLFKSLTIVKWLAVGRREKGA